MKIDIMLYSLVGQVHRVDDKQSWAVDWTLGNRADDVHGPWSFIGKPNTVRSAAEIRPEPEQCDTMKTELPLPSNDDGQSVSIASKAQSPRPEWQTVGGGTNLVKQSNELQNSQEWNQTNLYTMKASWISPWIFKKNEKNSKAIPVHSDPTRTLNVFWASMHTLANPQ